MTKDTTAGGVVGEVFVFGSNLAGRHGKGAALHARLHHGAMYGRGHGLQGSSYAIPTKDDDLVTLPLLDIAAHVATFISFAQRHPELTFRLTPIGCGLAGYRHEQIAPMFRDAPANAILPPEFAAVLGSGRNLADAHSKSDPHPEPVKEMEPGWKPDGWRWGIGTLLRKHSGAWWEGRVVGFYSTIQTPHGYNLQLDRPFGPTQIYPEEALEPVPTTAGDRDG